jgi:hypothetical protein
MGLNTGGTSGTTNTTNSGAASGQAQTAINNAGGLGAFATPSSLYQLTPAEQTFQGMGMGLDLPGQQASRALGYVQPGTPGGDMFQNYFKNFIAPVVTNNAISGGYGGASGANMEALSRAGQQAAMQGLTSFGMPMAQADQSNNQQGLGYAGLQRQSSLQDFGRIQNLIQSLLGYLPTNVAGSTTGQTQGPGLGASLLNGAGSLLGSLFNGGAGGSGGSLGASLLGSLGSGAAGLGSSALSGLQSLFGGGGVGTVDNGGLSQSNFSPDILSGNNPGSNPFGITDSGVQAMDPQMMSWLSNSGG